MIRQENPTIYQYLIGGLFGNAPLLFAIFAITFLDPAFADANTATLNAILFATMLGGAALSSFFVSIGVQSSDIYRVVTVGAVTGAFCFLVNYALALFFGWLLGFPLLPFEPRAYLDYVKLVMFIAGGIVGAYVRRLNRRVPRRPPPSSAGTSNP